MKTKTTYALYSIFSFILCAYFIWSAYATVQTADSIMFQMAIAIGAMTAGFIFTAKALGVSLSDDANENATMRVLDTHHNDYIHSEIEAIAA